MKKEDKIAAGARKKIGAGPPGPHSLRIQKNLITFPRSNDSSGNARSEFWNNESKGLKMNKKLLAACVALAGIAVAGPASAQPNPNGTPNYGTVTLSSGFTPDPRVISLRAGGDRPGRDAASNCTGFITASPAVRLNYSAGSLPLIVSVAASSDTTLVINAPDGRWYCNDDGGVNGSNPAVRFNSPQSGRYEIWVGTYRSGQSQPARLHISEVSSQ